MLSSRTLTNISAQSFRSSHPLCANRSYNALPSCSLRLQEIPVDHGDLQASSVEVSSAKSEDRDVKGGGKEGKGIYGIRVPRQKYIAVSKSELLDSILSIFKSQEDVAEFLRLSSFLDSILHAEHKGILEEIRIYYSLNNCMDEPIGFDSGERYEEEKVKLEDLDPFKNQQNLESLLSTAIGNFKRKSVGKSRVAVATRFQRIFMKLLDDAQFEELSPRDLMLTSALNTDYLLTLPIYVDWKRASESNAVIFRRGYTTEKQKGLLIVEKLDYLQSKLLQGILFMLSKPLGKVGLWMKKAMKSASQAHGVQVWTERIALWLKEPSFIQYLYSDKGTFDNQLGVDQLSDSDLPIWLASQRALPRYEGILSSVGPRGKLLRKLLMWIGLIPSMPEKSHELDTESSTSEPYLRPIFLPRISLSDIWMPATRKSCENDFWKLLKMAVSILFSQSTLQEPAFQELILFYTEHMNQREDEDNDEVPSLRLKIYERIPIPDLPVIFPYKKLSFRILDAVRLDIATIVGLLAYIVNYKFEDILSSPSAVMLDVIAVSALIIYVTRVVLGYKQTRDRYQLLVNRTLYEKTLASDFGSVHFLLDASEQQQYKESILAYTLLLQAQNDQVIYHKNIGDICEKFMYDKFKKKVAMPVDKAISTLLRLGLVKEVTIDGNITLQAIQCSKACEALKQRWNCLLDLKT